MRAHLRTLITALAVVAGALVLLTAVLWIAQRRIIYLPDRELATVPGDVTVRTVETGDGVVHRVWVVPAEGDAVARVLIFNGNAGNKAHRVPLARNLAASGMEVLLFDYRGYGDTEGNPSEEGLLADAEAVADAMFDSDLPVVYFGESLGAGVASGLATLVPPDALVLRSPFPSLAGVARVHYAFVPSFLLHDRYPVADQIGALDVPVLVVLGTSDSIVPRDLSRRVFEAAPGPKELVEMPGLNHNDAGLSSSPALAGEVREFLERAGVVSP